MKCLAPTLTIGLLALVSACATSTPNVVAPENNNPAVVSLLQQSGAAAAAGHPRAAGGLLERALRIAPHDAVLWHALAVLRLAHHPNQARNLAAKSNQLSPGDRELHAQNWALIAAAFTALGQPQRAAMAENRVQSLRAQ